jgi:hypothetical protein
MIPAAGRQLHRPNQTRIGRSETSVFLDSLRQNNAEFIDLERAADQVESFRSADTNEISRLAEAIPAHPLPLAKGLIAQALLRIPDLQVVQIVFNAACAETDPAAREAVLLAFHSIELPADHELFTTAIAASDDPQILSFIHASIIRDPQPETAAILQELQADPTTPPASQDAIRDALAGMGEGSRASR